MAKNKKKRRMESTSNNSSRNKSGTMNSKKKPTKNLREIYGDRRISETLVYEESFKVKNPQIIKYGFLRTDGNSPDFDIKHNKPSSMLFNNKHHNLEEEILSLLEKTKEMVCISSFLFQNNTKVCEKLFDLSSRGINIYFILGSERLVKKIDRDEEGVDNIKDHIDFLNKAGSGHMYIRTGDFHSKFVLIDVNTQDPQGILLTANITQRALTENNELGIKLNKKETIDLFQLFLYGFYSESQHELRYDENTNQLRLESIKQVEKNLRKSEKMVWTTKSIKRIHNELEKLISHYQEGQKIYISSWNFVNDNDISESISKIANSDTKILLPKREKNYTSILALIEKGVKIRCNRLQHAKFIIIRNKAIIFSSNFESQGIEKGFEAGKIIENSSEVEYLKKLFDFWFDYAESIPIYNQSIENFTGRDVEVITKRSIAINGSNYFHENFSILESNQDRHLKLDWDLESFMLTSDPEKVKKTLLNQNKLSNTNYVLESTFKVRIFPKKVANNVELIKSIKNFHLWQIKNSKNRKRYLVLNFDPRSNSKKYENARIIATEEKAELILY